MIHSVLSSLKKVTCIVVALAFSLLAPLSNAQVSPSPTVNNKPISIDADNQQINLQDNTITFTGNVIVIQEGLKVKANTVIITDMQSKDNQIITAYGKPVYFEQVYPNSQKQPITGHSNQLVYHVKQNTVTLIGGAELFRQDNHIVSDKIIYDVNQQKIQAQSDNGGRVKTTIVPNQVKESQQ